MHCKASAVPIFPRPTIPTSLTPVCIMTPLCTPTLHSDFVLLLQRIVQSMKALAIFPSDNYSARLIDYEADFSSSNCLHVEMVCVGICGTDQEILAGKYGQCPPGSD